MAEDTSFEMLDETSGIGTCLVRRAFAAVFGNDGLSGETSTPRSLAEASLRSTSLPESPCTLSRAGWNSRPRSTMGRADLYKLGLAGRGHCIGSLSALRVIFIVSGLFGSSRTEL